MRMLLIVCEIAAIWSAAAVLLRPVFAMPRVQIRRLTPPAAPASLDTAA